MFLFEAGGTLQGVAGTATAITLTMSGVEVDMTSGAETFKVLVQTQLPISVGVLGTVPSGKAWIVKTLTLNNATASAVTGIQLFQNGAAAANSIIGGVTMAGHYTFTSSENGWSMVDAAGVIQQSGGGGGGGTVSSVGLSMPSQFAVSGSPVTGSGTLTAAWNNQTPNTGLFGPNGGAPSSPSFRTMVDADFPLAGSNSVLVGSGASGSGSHYVEIGLGSGLLMSGTTLNTTSSGSGIFAGTLPSSSVTGFTTAVNSSAGLSSTDTAYGQSVINTTSASGVAGFVRGYPGVAYTMSMLVSIPLQAVNNDRVGIIICNSVTTQLMQFNLHFTGTAIDYNVLAWTNPNTFSSAVVGNTAIFPSESPYFWLRMKDNGTNITFSISTDGNYWIQVYTVAKSASFLGSSGFNFIGFGMNSSSGIGSTIMAYTFTTP